MTAATGSAEAPYLIATKDQFNRIRDFKNGENVAASLSFKLKDGAVIDLGDYTTIAGTFSGMLDGNCQSGCKACEHEQHHRRLV